MTAERISDVISIIGAIFIINMVTPADILEITENYIICIFYLLFTSLLGIPVFFCFSLSFSKLSPYIPITISTFTYIRRCFLGKKYLPRNAYTFCFPVESLFYIVEITYLFGLFYIKPSLDIIYAQDESVYFDFGRQCFDTGLRYFFTQPLVYSIRNPHFVQYYLGFIIGGSIIASLIKIISDLITPQSQQEQLYDLLKQIDCPKNRRK